jgi:hypothetical protein
MRRDPGAVWPASGAEWRSHHVRLAQRLSLSSNRRASRRCILPAPTIMDTQTFSED